MKPGVDPPGTGAGMQQVVARTQDDGTVAKELFSPENLKHNTLGRMNWCGAPAPPPPGPPGRPGG